MTAAVLYVAEELLGYSRKAIYDGSWTEYVNQNQLSYLYKKFLMLFKIIIKMKEIKTSLIFKIV